MNSGKFNSHYERYLSPYGKKVLGNLLKNFEEKKKCNTFLVQDRYNYGQKKYVLNFGESHISPSPNLSNPNVYNDVFPNVTIDKNHEEQRDMESTIISSHGLLITAAENEFPVNVSDRCMGPKNSAQYHPSTIITPAVGEGDTHNDTVSTFKPNNHNHIDDKQLLDDLKIMDTEVTAQKDGSEHNDENSFRVDSKFGRFYKPITVTASLDETSNEYVDFMNPMTLNNNATNDVTQLPIQNTVKQACLADHSEVLEKPREICCNRYVASIIPTTGDVKKHILKRQNSSKVVDITDKKIRKLSTKNTFRKQKYTKTVKTWLNNVDRAEFEDIVKLNNNNDDDKNKQAKIEINKYTKKTIQSQLTNKGGVMKYGKPKSKEIAEHLNDSYISAESLVRGMNTGFEDKGAKPKFRAPIRSQVPVKNCSYTIVYLSDDNINEKAMELSSFKDEHVQMILIFSNGFCQLSSHYTGESCEVEGVMFQVSNVLYYWKSVNKMVCGAMDMLIQHNTIVCYDGKMLLKYLTSENVIVGDITKINVLDVQIGANLMDPENAVEKFVSVQKMTSSFPEYTLAAECGYQKCARHLTALGECFVKLRTLLKDSELWKVFVDIEMRVLPIVAEMEQRGVRVDIERLKCMEDVVQKHMKRTEQACHAAAGRAFLINSTLQVRSILYDDLQLDSRSNLRSLMPAHPLPKLILEYRQLHKAHATFLAGISNQVKQRVVTPTWVQTAAATGRIASNNPNLQAIPKAPFSLEPFPPGGEREEDTTEPKQMLNFRSVYVPRDGHVFLAADFKHIECRVFAYAAADTSLLDALASPDLFRVLTARWLNKCKEQVTSADRERTKRIVYASLYGAGTRRLMEILDVSYDQTLSIMASFNRTFPSLKSFGRAVVTRCVQNAGRLTTLCGRGRTFKNICSDDFALRSHAERQAVNFVVQGSAADLCKMAMVATVERLRAADPPVRGHLLLQIHDELVWEVERHDIGRAAAEIKSSMEGIGNACGMAVTLPVAVSVGHTWGDMEDFSPTAQRQSTGCL